MTKQGLQLIKDFEGFRENAYQDSVGVWTIGYGFTYYDGNVKVKKGDKMDKATAEEYLNKLSEKNYGTYVDKYVTSKINPYMRDALISFAYNLGVVNLKNSTLLKKVNINPNDTSIKNEFLKWNKAGGKVLTGLTRRREAEADLYFTPPYTEEEKSEENKTTEEAKTTEIYVMSFKGKLEK